MQVSIHAPARGRTGGVGHAARLRSFNPRPRAGANEAVKCFICFGSRFQSTPPRGGEPAAPHSRRQTDMFQSTPPRGGERRAWLHCKSSIVVSIHAPARGRTRQLMPACGIVLAFQSTPPRGGEHDVTSEGTIAWQFQSTPPRGGERDATTETCTTDGRVSIHAPARGRTCSAAFAGGS